jgi:dTDP-4-amino-4,6-dideoxygalactose transaminase
LAADRYEQLLEGVEGVVCPKTRSENVHVWHLYVIRVNQRDRVVAALEAADIQVGIHYPVPIHLHHAYSGLGYGVGSFPVSEAAAGEILSLPMFPHITAEQQERVVDVLSSALR